MDKSLKYKQVVKNVLQKHLEIVNRRQSPNLEDFLVADDERGHYFWLRLGWEKAKKQNYQIVYIRLHDGKIWIEEDRTEDGIATDLLEKGVPKEDIVLAFYTPEERKFTEFAVA